MEQKHLGYIILICIGIRIMDISDHSRSNTRRSHLFLTIFILITGSFLAAVLIQKTTYETQRNQLLADQAAIAFENEFRDRILFLEIIQNGWITTDDPETITDEGLFYLKMPSKFDQVPGITAISFLNTSGVIVFRYPQIINDPLINTSICINKDGTFNSVFALANSTRNMMISPPKMLQINEHGYVIYCPLVYNDTLFGFFNMVFTITDFVETYLQDQPLLPDYDIQIWDDGTQIYTTCPDDVIEINGNMASTFEVLGRTWGIYVISPQHSIFNLSTLLIWFLWAFSVGVVIFYEKSLEKRNTSLQEAIYAKTETENKLRQVAKMEAVGQLAGGIAHDFNNILTAIQGFAELALMDLDDPASLKSNLEEIQLAENRAANLVKQLLTFSRKQVIQPKTLDLNQHLVPMKSLLDRLIREDVDLVMKLSDTHEMLIFADPMQIETVIINLVANARDAVSANGKIVIETSLQSITDRDKEVFSMTIPVGEYVLLSVSDNGMGMTQEIKDHLFEPFFTTKDVEKGTGLGLSTVFGIVTQNSGYINVYSEVGEGSTFNVYLPLSYLKTSEEPSKTRSELKNVFLDEERDRGMILIVEDDPSVKKILSQAISNMGYQMLSASNGVEALEVISQHGSVINLLITDMIMPKMTGKELGLQIAEDYPKIPVLFISGYTKNFLGETEILDSQLNFLQKPFTMEALLTKIQDILHPSE